MNLMRTLSMSVPKHQRSNFFIDEDSCHIKMGFEVNSRGSQQMAISILDLLKIAFLGFPPFNDDGGVGD